MSYTILIVGAGPNQIKIILKAQEMGLRTIAIDGAADAIGLKQADVGAAVNITDANAIADVAREHKADGIWPGAEAGVIAVAEACAMLGLPGPTPESALCMRSKLAMREALSKAGVPDVPFRSASDVEDAVAAAEELGVPVIVKPADGNASKGVQQVDHIADVSLAFARASKMSASGTVLIEAFIPGEEFNVDGLVHDGVFYLGGITGKDLSPLPYRYDLGIWMPPLVDKETSDLIGSTVEHAVSAIGYTRGTVHVEVMLSPEGPRVVEMAGRPGGGRIPTDLIPRTYGWDYTADSIRVALGLAPEGRPQLQGATSVYWVKAPSGAVDAITGIEEARASEGVFDIVMKVKPGDCLGHIIDCATRDKIGFVMTEADTPDRAAELARAAAAKIEVHTTRVYTGEAT